MENINTFSKGMVKDRSVLDMEPSTYFDARNVRILTERGSSNGALVNASGNSFSFSLPPAPRIFKILRTSISLSSPWTFIITINTSIGTLTSSISGSIATDEEFFSILYKELTTNIIYSSLIVSAPSPTSLIVYMPVDVGNIDSIVNYSSYITNTITGEYTERPYIIGYGNIREKIVLFTTTNVTPDPGYGQIYVVTYDDLDNPTIELKYNGLVNFSTEYPISARGRYENSKIQRIYWTDNHNPLRSLNIADINSLILEPSELDIQPQVDLNQPKIQSIDEGGRLIAGTYQYSYRLKGKGRVSNFSPVSKMVHIIDADSNAAYFKANAAQYIGTDVNSAVPSNKLVKLLINNIDSRYDTIEVCYLYRQDHFSDPEIRIFEESIVSPTGEMIISHSGQEEVFDVSVSEFNNLGVPFKTVKCLEVKDNRLLVANIKENMPEEIEFNARAYRWNASQETYVGSGTALSADWMSIDPFDPTINQDDLNAINPYNTDETLEYKYQSDGVTLGGEGVNVKYTFFKYMIEGDSTYSQATASQPSKAPFILKAKSDLNIDLNEGYTYTQTNEWLDYKAPIVNGTLKGYMRGEVYRFGIVFFDKKNYPSYVNWIGDIKFPEFWEEDTIGSGNWDEFQLAHKDGYNDSSDLAFMYSLGINFEINIPEEIRDKINGYSIVRVEREDKDKSRLGTGLIQGVFLDANITNPFTIDPVYMIPHKFKNKPDVAGILDPDVALLYCPEFNFRGYSGFRTGDKLRIFAISEEVPGYKDNTGMQPNTEYYKWWDCNATAVNATLELTNAFYTQKGQKIVLPGLEQFINYSYHQFDEEGYGVGNDVLFLDLSDNNIDWEGMNPYATDFKDLDAKYYGAYIRVNTDQYGGATESARSKNEYIQIGNYIEVDNNTSYTFKVFGGDTYVSFFGSTLLEKNIGDALSTMMPNISYPGVTTPTDAQMTGGFFPVECTFNNDLRKGYHLANKADFNGDFPDILASGLEGQYAFDQYSENRVYSYMTNNIIFYIPKPFGFISEKEFDNIVYASETKVNGELTDSWVMFEESTNIIVDGSYGPINSLAIVSDTMFFLQENAVGILSVNPVAVVNDQAGQETKLGEGGVLDSFKYITVEAGTRHQYSVVAAPTSLYWFDANKKKFFRYAGDGTRPVSDIQGMFGFFNKTFTNTMLLHDNPIERRGITGVYDNVNNEVVYTFLDLNKSGDNSFTLAYNEIINAYTSFYDFLPSIYIKNNRRILTPSTNLDSWYSLYQHNKGNYGTYYDKVFDSTITFISNDNPAITKIFDNLSWYSQAFDVNKIEYESKTIKYFRVYNGTQNTDWVTLLNNSNLERRERNWNTYIPRNVVRDVLINSDIFDPLNLDSTRLFKERIRDKYIYVDLKIDNADNLEYIINYVKTLYRVQAR